MQGFESNIVLAIGGGPHRSFDLREREEGVWWKLEQFVDGGLGAPVSDSCQQSWSPLASDGSRCRRPYPIATDCKMLPNQSTARVTEWLTRGSATSPGCSFRS